MFLCGVQQFLHSLDVKRMIAKERQSENRLVHINCIGTFISEKLFFSNKKHKKEAYPQKGNASTRDMLFAFIERKQRSIADDCRYYHTV